ncbi:GntR family transcriptional regulator [Leucobacter sp. M11]|uniref:GntR family transcriptional regulator n=1 Tax=Leucobacter sp. M11 TaxID=2993565 RepID=UPI002D7EABBC|nr:GntR family transcriptional regulator [Leucobacter sp. M11]MEB4615737.1 GntR family transcriptional regulator [Leucobacter sp. M11]
MARPTSLVSQVSQSLRNALARAEYGPGERLPTETELAEQFGVSRPTVRAALRELETKGLVRTQHGVGSFVTDRPMITAGLERLDSISESIRAMGREPGMTYESRTLRPLLPDEVERMGVANGTSALEARRSLLADGEVVAYSYDLIPVGIWPERRDPAELTGSIFRALSTELGYRADHSLAEIHALSSPHIGWGPEADDHSLFLLLDQLHYDAANTLLLYSRTYFIEGRYTFSMLRQA